MKCPRCNSNAVISGKCLACSHELNDQPDSRPSESLFKQLTDAAINGNITKTDRRSTSGHLTGSSESAENWWWRDRRYD